MNRYLISLLLAAVATSTAGCGNLNVNLWPFGEESGKERRPVPANAAEYQCPNNKRVFLRTIDNGDAVWLILPEREFRLDKQPGDAGTRYAKGNNTLELQGDQLSLKEGATAVFTGCKAAGRV